MKTGLFVSGGIFLLIFLTTFIGRSGSPILCPDTGKIVYYYQGNLNEASTPGVQVKGEDFKPVFGVKQPKQVPLVCPGTETPLNGFEYWFWARGYEKPKMVYPGYTFLTKENDKSVWKPVDISKWED